MNIKDEYGFFENNYLQKYERTKIQNVVYAYTVPTAKKKAENRGGV